MDRLLEFFRSRRGARVGLARHLGISPSAISQWGSIPIERVLEVERFTGIPRHELRPDIYPAPTPQEAAE